MNFEDQDWYREQESPRPSSAAKGVWQLAVGVAVGIVIGGVLMWAIDHDAARQDATPPVLATPAERPPAEPTAVARPAEPPGLLTEPTAAGAPAARTAPLPASEPPPVAMRGQDVAPQDAEAQIALAMRAAQRAAERKERAWAMFYKKPAACDESPPKASMVECANHFIRAKREFEQLYEAGKRAPGGPAVSASRPASGS